MAVKDAAQETAEAVATSAKKAGGAVKKATGKAVKSTKEKTKKAAGAAATTAAKAVTREEPLHYDAVVNKRGLSVNALTKTLNARWEDGWRLAHVLEQRGNTVLVFERRS